MAPKPLTPLAALKLKTGENIGSIDQDLIMATHQAEEKIIYSTNSLKDMRHNRDDEPASKSPSVLAMLKKGAETEPAQVNNNGFTTKFGASFLTDILKSMKNERGQLCGGRSNNNNGRPIVRAQPSTSSNQPSNSQPPIRVNIMSEVKLRKAENAWKPTFMNKKTDTNDETELYKQVRSILNKLTATNFNVLTEQFKQLQIATPNLLDGVVDLVFNKAVDEPSFSIGYAHLCQYLSSCSEGIVNGGIQKFKRTLISRCQSEFEKNVCDKGATEKVLAPYKLKIKQYKKDGDKDDEIAETKALMIEIESKLRRRLVSTVRFIGELYKLDMLTTKIMYMCVLSLVRDVTNFNSTPNEIQVNLKIECLCKLLKTIGAMLNAKVKIDPKIESNGLSEVMKDLHSIISAKARHFKPTARVKFLLLDILDLSNNDWARKITSEEIQLGKQSKR